MSISTKMKSLGIVLGFATLLATAHAARAGIFVGLGVTSPSNLTDTKTGQGDGSTERGYRVMGGYSIALGPGRLAGELAYNQDHATFGGNPYAGSLTWLAGRYNLPINNGFELYGRLGLSRTSVERHTMASDLSEGGGGSVVGVGAEYHPPLKLGVDAAIWVDIDRTTASLTGDAEKGSISTVDHEYALGISVGF